MGLCKSNVTSTITCYLKQLLEKLFKSFFFFLVSISHQENHISLFIFKGKCLQVTFFFYFLNSMFGEKGFKSRMSML